MSATATGLQLTIGATSDVQRGLDQAVSQFQGAVQKINGEARGLQSPARAAAREFDNLGGSLKKFVSEQRSEGRAAGFLVKEFLSPITSGSKLATEALSGLTAGLIGGGGVGLALEAVSFASKFFADTMKEASEAEKKASEASIKQAKAVRDAWVKSSTDVARALFIAHGGSSSDFDAILAGETEQTELIRTGNDLLKQRGELVNRIRLAEEVVAQRRATGTPLGGADERIETMRAQLAKVQELERQNVATVANIRELGRLRQEEAEKKAAEKEDKTEAARDRAGQAALDQRARAFEKAKREALERAKGEARAAGGLEGFEDGARLFLSPEDKERIQNDIDRITKQVQKLGQEGARVGEILGSALADAFKEGEGGARRFFLVMLDQVIAAVQAKAVEGAATAAAANAWNPFVAAGAAAAAFALIRGLLSQLPGRAGGGPVSGGAPYMVGERGPEAFVPGQSGAIVPNHALGGGPVTVNISALDGASVYRVIRANPHEFARAVRDLAKDGFR